MNWAMQWVVCNEINSYLEENAKLCSSVVNQIGSKYEQDFLKWSGRNWSCIHILGVSGSILRHQYTLDL